MEIICRPRTEQENPTFHWSAGGGTLSGGRLVASLASPERAASHLQGHLLPDAFLKAREPDKVRAGHTFYFLWLHPHWVLKEFGGGGS